MGRKKLILKRLPYLDTNISVDRSTIDIMNLLRKAGADGIQWSEIYKPNKITELKFVKGGIAYTLKIPVDVSDLESQRDLIAPYRYNKLLEKRRRGLFRAMYNYILGLCKAQEYGLMKFEEAFAGHINIRLPSGEMSTISDIVVNRNPQLMLGGGDVRETEDP
jgi:hypothetical protein